MSQVSKFANAHTIITTGYTNPSYAYNDDGVQYATAAPAKNANVESYFGFAGFSTSDIPDGATINWVQVDVEYKESVDISPNAIQYIQVFLNTAGQGTEVSDNIYRATDYVLSHQVSSGISLSDLRTADTVRARVRSRRQVTNTSCTFSLDYVKITVDYTAGSTDLNRSDLVSNSNVSEDITIQLETSLEVYDNIQETEEITRDLSIELNLWDDIVETEWIDYDVVEGVPDDLNVDIWDNIQETEYLEVINPDIYLEVFDDIQTLEDIEVLPSDLEVNVWDDVLVQSDLGDNLVPYGTWNVQSWWDTFQTIAWTTDSDIDLRALAAYGGSVSKNDFLTNGWKYYVRFKMENISGTSGYTDSVFPFSLALISGLYLNGPTGEFSNAAAYQAVNEGGGWYHFNQVHYTIIRNYKRGDFAGTYTDVSIKPYLTQVEIDKGVNKFDNAYVSEEVNVALDDLEINVYDDIQETEYINWEVVEDQPAEPDLNVDVYDNVTVEDIVEWFPDTIITREYVDVQIENIVDLYDDIYTSEYLEVSLEQLEDLNIDIFDLANTLEDVSIINSTEIDIFDISTVSEYIQGDTQDAESLYIDVFDNSIITESQELNLSIEINVQDNVSTSEDLSIPPIELFLDIYDEAFVSESVIVDQSEIPALNIDISDYAQTSENISLEVTFEVNTYEDIYTSEYLELIIPEVEGLSINVYDSIETSEFIETLESVEISLYDFIYTNEYLETELIITLGIIDLITTESVITIENLLANIIVIDWVDVNDPSEVLLVIYPVLKEEYSIFLETKEEVTLEILNRIYTTIIVELKETDDIEIVVSNTSDLHLETEEDQNLDLKRGN